MDQNNTKCLDLGITTLDEQYKINVYWRMIGLETMSYEEKLHKLIFVTTWQKKNEDRPMVIYVKNWKSRPVSITSKKQPGTVANTIFYSTEIK